MASKKSNSVVVVSVLVLVVVAAALFLGLRDVPAPVAEKVVEIDAATVAQ